MNDQCVKMNEEVDERHPLWLVLPEELKDIDPQSIFHDFNKEKPLRFGRMMQPLMKESSKLEIWWQCKHFYKRTKQLQIENNEDNKESEEIKSKNITEDDVVLDDLYLLLMPTDSLGQLQKAQDVSDDEEEITPWRNGPSKIWFDTLNLPNNATSDDLLEKLKKSIPSEESIKGMREAKEHEAKIIRSLNTPITKKWSKFMNHKAFLPVNLINWEENIVCDEIQGRKVFMKKYGKGRMPECGWIPTSKTKSYESWVNYLKCNPIETLLLNNPVVDVTFDSQNEKNLLNEKVSMFPFENYEFKNTRWENDIIYDPINLEKMPEPKVLVVDFKDDPRAYGIPQDCAPESVPSEEGGLNASDIPFSPVRGDKNAPAPTRKSKMILSQVQQRQKQEEEEQMENTMARFNDKDPFNLSCDEYYCASNKRKLHNTDIVIQHSVPAQNISALFFPTYLTVEKLRMFHRVPIEAMNRRFLRTLFHGRFIPIKGLKKYIQKKEQERNDIKQAEGGGDYFFMREPKDLSGKDGTLLLLEYMEEHPPLLSQPGMASVIRNYHRRKPGVDPEVKMDFGSLTYTHSSPFLGNIPPGTTIQSLENNMYSAPIFQHKPKFSDFLLIRTKEGFFIRKHPALFVVGQEHPSFEVPSPNSKAATNFFKDFIMAFIYRLFVNSTENPKRIKIEDIRQAFPNQAEPSIRKRLKLCSDFKRFDKGNESNYWVLRDDFRLPSIEEIKAMVTPEMCCAQYSMMTEERRLQDAGYRVKNNVIQEKENDSEDEVALEDEQKCASWNTTRAFLLAKSGRCVLDNTGIADPTGKGYGFSFVRVSSKPPKEAKKDEVPGPKKLVTGTNADLRKLPLKEAKEICRSYGLTDEDLSKLTRWEIIDVIRSLSTQSVGKNENGGLSRFARGNVKFNFSDMQDKFKKHCKEIWEKQVDLLGNTEEPPTDDGETGEESENEDDKKVQEKLESKELTEKEKRQLEYEREERERKEFKNALENGSDSLLENSNFKNEKKKKKNDDEEWENKKLIINRVVRFGDRPDERRSETVTDPEVIKYYVKIKQNKDLAYIKAFAEADDDYKEEKRREKRRLKDKLRRIQTKSKTLKENDNKGNNEKKEQKPVAIKESLLKMKCSACGELGHMKTNKHCNLYGQRETKIGDICKTIDDSLNDDDSRLSANGSVVLDGFKMKIPKTIVQKKGKVPKIAIPKSALSKAKGDESIQSTLGGINDDTNDSPAYFTDISLEQTIHDSDIDNFTDVDMIDDSNHQPPQPIKRGPGRPPLPATLAKRKAMEGCDYLAKPVKNVQRRRADPRVSMATILTEVMNEIKNVPGYVFFNKPVSEKVVKDYYTIVKNPIDLQTIKKKIDNHEYELRKTFIEDLKLLVDNSMLYNGIKSEFTMTACKIFDVAKEKISFNDDRLIELEKQINPLLDDNDIVGFSYILGKTVQQCKLVPKSTAFHVEVDRHKNPSYYCYILKPMHLGLLEHNVEKRIYSTVDSFLVDVRLIYENSKTFNTENHDLTKKAAEIVRRAIKYLRKCEDDLRELESNIIEQKAKEGITLQMSSFFLQRQPEEIEEEQPTVEVDPTFGDLELSDTDEEGEDYDTPELKKPRFEDSTI
uniref:Bromo domain-containing protein n=1 Tax=Strongyloides stercoralis TaxID=6248 RepID=A0A0K0EDD0_STRER